jgi:hypothetical protein
MSVTASCCRDAEAVGARLKAVQARCKHSDATCLHTICTRRAITLQSREVWLIALIARPITTMDTSTATAYITPPLPNEPKQ